MPGERVGLRPVPRETLERSPQEQRNSARPATGRASEQRERASLEKLLEHRSGVSSSPPHQDSFTLSPLYPREFSRTAPPPVAFSASPPVMARRAAATESPITSMRVLNSQLTDDQLLMRAQQKQSAAAAVEAHYELGRRGINVVGPGTTEEQKMATLLGQAHAPNASSEHFRQLLSSTNIMRLPLDVRVTLASHIRVPEFYRSQLARTFDPIARRIPVESLNAFNLGYYAGLTEQDLQAVYASALQEVIPDALLLRALAEHPNCPTQILHNIVALGLPAASATARARLVIDESEAREAQAQANAAGKAHRLAPAYVQ